MDCGHHVCGTCRDRLLSLVPNNDECPVCREPNVLSYARLNRHLQRQVYSLIVRCKHHNEGCEWVGELRYFQKHLDRERGECTYVAKMIEHAQQIKRE